MTQELVDRTNQLHEMGDFSDLPQRLHTISRRSRPTVRLTRPDASL